MNAIRQTQLLNKRELENAIPPSASWHADYRDTAYVYVGGLPFDVSEGDIVTIFSQYGNPTHVNLIRDRETGKSKGFAFLKYEDQRSCDLAVDNLGGAEVLGRMLRVDHTRYKKREDEDEDAYRVDKNDPEVNGNGKRASEAEETEDDGRRKRHKKRKPKLKEEAELEELLQVKDGEEEDPMRQYMIDEKKAEVANALVRAERKEKKHRHHHRRREDGDEAMHMREPDDEGGEHGRYSRTRPKEAEHPVRRPRPDPLEPKSRPLERSHRARRSYSSSRSRSREYTRRRYRDGDAHGRPRDRD